VTLSNVPPDAEVATVEMVAWDNSSGLYPTWTEAREAWTQGPLAAGMSGTLNVSNIGGFVNPPPVLTGLQSFNLWWIHQPTIIKSPLTQTVETGTTVQLFVITDSPGPSLAYTWFLDTTNALPGVTNAVLQLTDVQPSQAGAYTVTVTNMGFAMTSAPAMLSVISAVDRKGIIALGLTGSPGSVVHVEYSDSLDALQWLSLADMTLNSETQPCFDLTQPLQTQRFYRAWQTNEPPPGLAASIAPAISLTGSIGSSVRIDYINAIGPTDAWVTLETVTLTNTPQLYVDVSASGQPRRLYRLVPVP
jgi:hypothetical protein